MITQVLSGETRGGSGLTCAGVRWCVLVCAAPLPALLWHLHSSRAAHTPPCGINESVLVFLFRWTCVTLIAPRFTRPW